MKVKKCLHSLCAFNTTTVTVRFHSWKKMKGDRSPGLLYPQYQSVHSDYLLRLSTHTDTYQKIPLLTFFNGLGFVQKAYYLVAYCLWRVNRDICIVCVLFYSWINTYLYSVDSYFYSIQVAAHVMHLTVHCNMKLWWFHEGKIQQWLSSDISATELIFTISSKTFKF